MPDETQRVSIMIPWDASPNTLRLVEGFFAVITHSFKYNAMKPDEIILALQFVRDTMEIGVKVVDNEEKA